MHNVLTGVIHSTRAILGTQSNRRVVGFLEMAIQSSAEASMSPRVVVDVLARMQVSRTMHKRRRDGIEVRDDRRTLIVRRFEMSREHFKSKRAASWQPDPVSLLRAG